MIDCVTGLGGWQTCRPAGQALEVNVPVPGVGGVRGGHARTHAPCQLQPQSCLGDRQGFPQSCLGDRQGFEIFLHSKVLISQGFIADFLIVPCLLQQFIFLPLDNLPLDGSFPTVFCEALYVTSLEKDVRILETVMKYY